MPANSLKNNLVLVLKIAISLAAIYLVFSKVRLNEIVTIMATGNVLFLTFALISYVLSKLVSAARTHAIIESYEIPVTGWQNLRIYWTGMFYNLFLPGGIGGDIYRTIVINRTHERGIKLSTAIVLMDRVTGVAALLLAGLSCIVFTPLFPEMRWIVITGIPATLAGFFIFSKLVLPGIKKIYPEIIGQSMLVQALQILSLYLILTAFNIGSGQISYILIFLVSSVAAMLPISVGGIGIREITFLAGSAYLHLEQETAVTVSFAFYLITVIASLAGLFSGIDLRSKQFYTTQ